MSKKNQVVNGYFSVREIQELFSMKTSMLVKGSYIISIITVLLGALLKIQRIDTVGYLLTLGMIATGVFIIAAIMEVNRSQKISEKEKGMWTIGFIFLSGIVGLVYMISGRKRVL